MTRVSGLSTFVSLLILTAASGQEVVGRWRFELGPGPVPEGEVRPKGKAALAESVAGAYVYDPVTEKSAKNTSSLSLGEDGRAVISLDGVGEIRSFTLEAFVRPARDPGAGVPLVMLAGGGGDTVQAGLHTEHLSRWNQTYLGARFARPGGKPQTWNPGYYLGTGRIRGKDDPGWRHLAMVYDAEAGEMAMWLDHYQVSRKECPAGLDFGGGRLHIGGPGEGGKSFSGEIDEIRLTRGVLPRTKFLRARADAIEGVAFTSEAVVLPPDSGYIDLKLAFGAVGDGKTDDTEAFRRAFEQLANKVPLREYVLYVPPGKYLISGEIRWTRFLFVQGAGPERTVLKLKDSCEGYTDGDKPRGVVTVAWRDFTPEATGKAGNNIGSYLHDLTIDTGSGNPGAVALAYHSNNHGSVANVVLRSGDGDGWAGLSLADNWPGPCLIRDVTIDGFDRGVYSIVGQYSVTFRDLTLRNQNEVGIHNRNQMLWIDGLRSANRVPAMDANGIVCLVDAELTGGAEDVPAIRLHGGYGLYRDVTVDGYGSAIELEGETAAEGPNVEEIVFGKKTSLFDSPGRSLDLPLKDPPKVPREAPDKWVNLLDFAEHKAGDDWGPAVQAAVDSGARTLYVPNKRVLRVRTPVHVRGNVERLFGLYSGIGPHEDYDGPVLIYDHPDPEHVLVVERFHSARLHHASPGTMYVVDTSPQYTNEPGAGELYAEDTLGHYRIREQDAWFWQLNNEYETGDGAARFENHGGRVVIVGMKTEQKGANIMTTGGGLTELLGGYFYANSGTGGRPSIIIEDAGFSGTWRNFWAKYKPVVRETRGRETKGGGERYQGLFTGYSEDMLPPTGE